MTKKAVVAGAIFPLLAGCAAITPGYRVQQCNSAVCQIDVTVDANCSYDINPEKLEVVKGSPRVIQWRLPPASPYNFTQDGITFKSPNTEFHSNNSQGKVFSWTDRNATRGQAYPYNVRVEKGGVPCKQHDPSIVNMP